MGAFVTGLAFDVSTSNATVIKAEKAKVCNLSFAVSNSNASIITNRKGVTHLSFCTPVYWENITRISRNIQK